MRRKRRVAVAPWLLPAVALAGLIWFWWNAKVTPRDDASRLQAVSRTNAPFGQPAALTNRAILPLPRQGSGRTAVDTRSANHVRIPATNATASLDSYPRPVQSAFEMQIALARRGLSCGSIDGLIGPQTRAALRSFQQQEHLPTTGELDNITRACLVLQDAPITTYEVTSNDLARLQPLSPGWLGKSQQTALEYETLLESVSEKAHAHPALIKQLNPGLDWATVATGTKIELPGASYPDPAKHAAAIVIHLEQKVLEAFDEATNLLAHFPCSIGRRVEKRPVGELHVTVIAHDPNYTFDPENFPESSEAQQLETRLVLPPGPNNPVGTAWIGLDKPGYGIHGTPNPEQVGHTESHGCFRLANWNADYLARLVEIGTPVYVQP